MKKYRLPIRFTLGDLLQRGEPFSELFWLCRPNPEDTVSSARPGSNRRPR
jgi:hypothetical protein